jgi:Trm5-related predicted tRNA methylase
MIHAKFSLAAEGAAIDQQTNVVSVFNILETIQADGYPLFVQRLVFLALLTRDERDRLQTQLRFSVGIEEEELIAQDIAVTFVPENVASRVLVRFSGLVVPRPGSLYMTLRHGGEVISEYRIPVTQRQVPQTNTQISAPTA